MVSELRTFPLLDGYRAAAPCDVGALEDVLLNLSALAAARPEIAELDCNPVSSARRVRWSSTPASALAPRLRRARPGHSTDE